MIPSQSYAPSGMLLPAVPMSSREVKRLLRVEMIAA